jgi:hypothetical protein
MCSSSSNLRRAGSRLQASRQVRMKLGCRQEVLDYRSRLKVLSRGPDDLFRRTVASEGDPRVRRHGWRLRCREMPWTD